MTRPERPICDTCGHLGTDHGDRVLGICSYGRYPNRCNCDGFILWVKPKKKRKEEAA